jgi:mRNA interferase RelE/StbE
MIRNRKTILQYSKNALKDLRKISTPQSKKIIDKIFFETLDNPLSNAKRLEGKFSGFYRYRIGNYRAIFIYEEDVVILIKIIRIKHRKDIYK